VANTQMIFKLVLKLYTFVRKLNVGSLPVENGYLKLKKCNRSYNFETARRRH